MLSEGLKSILRTSRSEPTGRGLERRYTDLIKLYQEDEGKYQNILQYFLPLTHPYPQQYVSKPPSYRSKWWKKEEVRGIRI